MQKSFDNCLCLQVSMSGKTYVFIFRLFSQSLQRTSVQIKFNLFCYHVWFHEYRMTRMTKLPVQNMKGQQFECSHYCWSTLCITDYNYHVYVNSIISLFLYVIILQTFCVLGLDVKQSTSCTLKELRNSQIISNPLILS